MPEQEPYTSYNIKGHQYGVPDVVEENIKRQAGKVAYQAGRPDVAEDLEQEARLRAWEESQNGESNPPYLLADTKQAISGVARSGTDVDGKLWPAYERSKVYEIWSIDYVVSEDPYTTHGETIIDDKLSVEQQALGLVLLAEVYRLLTAEEQLILDDLLEEYYQREIAQNIQVRDRAAVRRRLRRIREKAAGYLGWEELG